VTAPVIALALFAAILHATWNAFLRSGADRLWTITVMSLSMVIVALPFAFILPLPPAAAWPWLIGSSMLQLGYCCFLVMAYRHGNLGQVYPVVRGIVPLLVTLGGYLFLSQRVPLIALLGIGLIAGGIMALATGKGRASPVSLGFAALTGLFIAAYATVDAKGVRIAGHAGSYAVWIYILYGSMMVLAFMAMRGRLRIDLRAPDTWKAIGGGMVSLVAYGAVMAAFALGPAGPITALRETSVIFAALIGRAFLGEHLSVRRLVACIVVVAGAVLVGYAR
jgi:drug/metabolite transporter (DMT)-like permease